MKMLGAAQKNLIWRALVLSHAQHDVLAQMLQQRT